MARRLVKLVAIGALTCAVGPVSVAYADPAPSWWEERSPEERRVIIDSFYTATGHAAPYLGEAATRAKRSVVFSRRSRPRPTSAPRLRARRVLASGETCCRRSRTGPLACLALGR
jgi:hypothetical protein